MNSIVIIQWIAIVGAVGVASRIVHDVYMAIILSRIKGSSVSFYRELLGKYQDSFIDRPMWMRARSDIVVMKNLMDAVYQDKCDSYLLVKPRYFFLILRWIWVAALALVIMLIMLLFVINLFI